MSGFSEYFAATRDEALACAEAGRDRTAAGPSVAEQWRQIEERVGDWEAVELAEVGAGISMCG